MRSLVLGMSICAVALVCCSSAPDGTGSATDNALAAARRHADAGVDAGVDAGPDSGTGAGTQPGTDAGSGVDGTPTRQACVSSFGSALSGSFGRLDGYVVSVVAPGSSKSCNDDSTHVHAQVSMGGAIYDVAINVDGGFWLATNLPLPDGAWSEGWHPADTLDYVSTLGLHSTDFAAVAQSVLEADVESALATANHISAFGTTYTGSDAGSGIHDIHRESAGTDGAIFLDPTTASPRALLFRFSTDTF